jgi:hypothetical protein
MQLLMSALPPESTAVAALLDFAKAYDTFDRGFLLECMAAMGVGQAFRTWVSTLLTGTHARVSMNGYVSDSREFQAGVRQGCPLAPLLYLFVGEALLRLLKANGVGLGVHGTHLIATQFADDTQVYLQSVAEVPQFLAVMDTMAAASGQHLNKDKTKLLLLGKQVRERHPQYQIPPLTAAEQRQMTPALQRMFQQNAASTAQRLQRNQLQLDTIQLQCVLQANILGIPVGSNAPLDWDSLLQGVTDAFRRLSYIPKLSTFGRGFGSAAYGVSKLLYAAEFSELPNEDQQAALTRAVAQLVDRGQPPNPSQPRFPGVAASLLTGSPKEGGFGALPWLQHIRARHAWWGAQFATAPADSKVPWICIGRSHLRKCSWWGPLALFDCSYDTQTPTTGPPPPAPLRRMIAGLQALGPVSDIQGAADQRQQQIQTRRDRLERHRQRLALQQQGQQQGQQQQQQQQGQQQQQRQQPLDPLTPRQQALQATAAPMLRPGPWCADVPLLGNHWLQGMPGCQSGGLQTLPGVRAAHAWDVGGGEVRMKCHTVGDLLKALNHIRILEATGQQHSSGIGTWAAEIRDLEQVIEQLPPGWHSAAAAVIATQPILTSLPTSPVQPTMTQQCLEIQLVHRLGWTQWASKQHVCLSRLTVKQATNLQMGTVRAARRQKYSHYVAEALPVRRARTAPGVGCVRQAHRQLWSLRWDNQVKELMWRLPLDGLANAQRMHNDMDTCLCGASQPGRSHHFWQCPVAEAVMHTISANLPATWCSRPATRPAVTKSHLWLMKPPPGPKRMHPGLWRVICLAALNAMDVGRKAANKFRMDHRQPTNVAAPPPADPQQQLITNALQPADPTAAQQQRQQVLQQRQQRLQHEAALKLAEAKQQAVAQFWLLLSDFTIMNATPQKWLPHVADDHPLLCREPLINNVVLAPRLG